MTDIAKLVKRLRASDAHPLSIHGQTMTEAADALEAQAKEIKTCQQTELTYITRVADMQREYSGMQAKLEARIAELEAENEKLREAMKPISLWSFEAKDNTPAIKELEDDILRVRAALKGEKG